MSSDTEGIPLYRRVLRSSVARVIHPALMRVGGIITMRDGCTYRREEDGSLRRVGCEATSRKGERGRRGGRNQHGE